MWTIAAVNKKFDGPLGTYNGLTDVHLSHYFSRPSRQSHLKAAKLITGDGTIIPEQKVKVASLQYERQNQIYDMLANTVIQNAALKEGSWNKKLRSYLEDVSKMEKVEAIKVGCKKTNVSQTKLFKNWSTVHPFKHLNIYEWFKGKDDEVASTFPRSASSTCKCRLKSHISPLHSGISKLKRCFSAKEHSPYIILNRSCSNQSHPHIHQMPTLKKKKRKRKRNNNSVQPQNSSLESTAVSKLAKLSLPDNTFNVDHCKVTLFYHGQTPLAKVQKGVKEDILIRQQHCGGNPVTVYKGQIAPNETVTFITLNHDGYNFSITLFLDGIRYLKLSSCCVFRYNQSRRLGGSSGIFSIQSIDGGKPCMRCQYRQIDACSKDLKMKLNCSENDVPFETDRVNAFPLNPLSKSVQPAFQNSNTEMHGDKTSREIEEAGDSIESEIINSPDEEEIEENVEEILNNPNSASENEIIEDEITAEDPNITFDEDIKDATESSYDSDSSLHSVTESVKHFVKSEEFQVKPYENNSSSEDDGGKQHIILASVHGSPSAAH